MLTSNYEGYGRTIIEALAVGLLVVSTDVGIASEYINNASGLVVPVGDKEALVNASLKIMRRKQQGNLVATKIVIKDMLVYDEYLRLYKESLEKLMLKE